MQPHGRRLSAQPFLDQVCQGRVLQQIGYTANHSGAQHDQARRAAMAWAFARVLADPRSLALK
jgi:hypothetical protein